MAKKKKVKRLSLDGIRSKYAGSGLAVDVMPAWDDLLWVPSSSPVMNYYLGGGAAYGRIMEIAGMESSGKTLLALNIMGQAQELGGVGIFVDAELAWSNDWAQQNGLDLDNIEIFEENIIEPIADYLAEICLAYRADLVNNEPIVLVVDSVAALDTQANMESTIADSKAEMGTRAKAFYKMIRLRNRIWSKLGIAVIFVNQLRDKINTGFGSQFQEKKTTVGGRALPFFASQRIFLESKKQETVGNKERKKRVGIEVSITVKKNKLSIPKSIGRVGVTFDPSYGDLGFAKYDGLVDILIKEGVLEKSGNSYSFDGEVVATSKSSILDNLLDDPELLELIFRDARIVTFEYMDEKLDDLDENLYPIDNLSIATFGDATDAPEDTSDEE